MRYIFSFFVILALFTGCKSPEENKSPKETVEAYLAATNRFDAEAAKKLLILNSDNLMLLETIRKMKKSIPDDQKARFLNREKNAIYTEKKITDSTAQIIVSPSEAAMPFKFNLKKTNQVWLIESITELY